MTLYDFLSEVKADRDRTDLERSVADILLDSYSPTDEEDLQEYVQQVIEYGCAGGSVPELIYYTETHRFYQENCFDIDALIDEYESETGEAVHMDGDRQNWMAWFAFERVTGQLSDEYQTQGEN